MSTNGYDNDEKDQISSFAFLLILFLFVFRFLISTDLFTQLKILWVHPLYQFGTYFISAWIVWIERRNFQKFNLDSLALIIFLIFRTFLWFKITQSIYNQIAHIGFFIVAIILFISIRKYDQTKISRVTIRQFIWLIAGVFVGYIIAIIQISVGKSAVTYSFSTYQL